jgi:hypothetical protein
MRFLHQQGYGMMAISKELLRAGVGSGVILSPRVSDPDQMARLAASIHECGGVVLFDPQFYVPHTSHERILEFPYWEGLDYDTASFDQLAARNFCRRVVDYQTAILHVDEVLLPGTYTNVIDDRWLSCQRHFAEEGLSQRDARPVYSTVAIGPDAIRSAAHLDAVVEETINSGVDGVYLLLRAPGDAFLVEDESYIYAALDGMLSLVESGKEVIVGYANQEALIFASVGVQTVASGNFRNVRSFNPGIFDAQEEDDRQRATWYYDAQTLSEFRIQTLQLAFRRGLLNLFGPRCGYCDRLLTSPDPITVRWTEGEAFRHWLHELNRQWFAFDTVRPRKRMDSVLAVLTAAQARLQQLRDRQVQPGERSFSAAFSPCFAALQALRVDREASLRELH